MWPHVVPLVGWIPGWGDWCAGKRWVAYSAGITSFPMSARLENITLTKAAGYATQMGTASASAVFTPL